MSAEDEDEDEDTESKPKRMGPQLTEIRRIMILEGIDYETAYNRVMNPKPKPEPFPTPTPPPEPKPQVSIEKLNELVASLNSDDMAQIELATEELEKLEEIIGLENVANIELSAQLRRRLGNLKSLKEQLEIKQRQHEKREEKFKEDADKLVKSVEEFNLTVAAHKKKRRGFVKKIKVDAESEFEEE